MPELNLDYDNTLYLLLNIISHDVIHDYNINSSSNKSRWENVQTYLDRVTNVDFFGGTSYTQTQTQTQRYRQSPKRSLQKTRSYNSNSPKINNFFNSTIPGRISGYSPISDQYYKTLLLEFFEYVRSQIILNAFHFIFADPEYLKNMSYTKKIKMDSIFYINYAKQNDVLPLQVSIVEKVVDDFYIYCKYVLKITDFDDFTHFLNILTQFLHSDIVEKCALKINQYQSGGVGILPDDNVKCANLVKDIDDFINANIDDWNTDFGDNANILLMDESVYLDYRKRLIEQVLKIYFKYIENKSMRNKININIVRMIRVQPKKILNRNDLNLNIEIKNAVLYGLTDCYSFLEQYKKKEEIVIKKKELNQKKLEAGEITDENTSCVNNFMKFIAKIGLLVMGICNSDGDFTYSIQNLYLKKQSSILRAIAHPEKENNKKDLDSDLYEFFKTDLLSKKISNIDLIDESKINNWILTHKKKSVINNAAPLKESLKKYIFCPYSSIIDGMSNCSFNTATNNYGIESGDMNFIIQHTPLDDTSIFVKYQGFLKIKKNDNINVGFVINATNMIISNELDTNLKTGSELKAYVVLRKSLQVIIDKIDVLINKEGWKSTTELWRDLFIYGQNQDSYTFFGDILKEILFKGCGDLFQEINAVMKNGGYVNIPKYSNMDIIPFSQRDSIPTRYFFAHDRPSALRFIFMLKHGNVNEINEKAVGGYYDINEKLIVQFINKNITKPNITKPNITKPNITKPNITKQKKRKFTSSPSSSSTSSPSSSSTPSPSPYLFPFSYSYPHFSSENNSKTQLNKTQKTNQNNLQRLQSRSISNLTRKIV